MNAALPWIAAILVVAKPVYGQDIQTQRPIGQGVQSVATWRPYIDEASRRFDVPGSWIERVIAAESAGQTERNGRPITSRAGAMGLMQLMPATYKEMAILHDLGADPYDPRDNILAGTAYLRAMFDRYGYPGVFAAYNAGPTRYEGSLRGLPLPAETREYMAKVTGQSPDISDKPLVILPVSGAILSPTPETAAAIFIIRRSASGATDTDGEAAGAPEGVAGP